MQRDGRLIAASSAPPGSLMRERDGTFAPIQATESDAPLVAEAARRLTERPGGLALTDANELLTFSLDGARQYLQATTFAPAPGLSWILVAVVPKSDFMGRIEGHRQHTLALIGVVLVLAIGLGILMATRIAMPMERLGRDAERLALGHWEREFHHTPMREFNLLNTAFRSMSGQLRNQFERLREQAT